MSLVKIFKAAVLQIFFWLVSPQVTWVVFEPWLRLLGFHRTREWNPACVRNILVIRVDEIGDVVLTTPFLRELRRNFPNAWLTLVVKPSVLNLVELCPYVNQILTYEWNTPGRLWLLKRHVRALGLAWRHLWPRRFDVAVIPRLGEDSYHAKILAYLSGACWRVAYAEGSFHTIPRNPGLDMLMTHPVLDHNPNHSVQKHLDILRFLGLPVHDDALELWTNEADEAMVQRICQDIDVAKAIVVLCPVAGKPVKCWPAERFVAIGQWLQQEFSVFLVLVGGCAERTLGEGLHKQLGSQCLDLIGKVTLRQLTAIFRRCRLFIGNDTGPMHVAAAVQLPVVEIAHHPQDGDVLHLSSPSRFGPYKVPHIVVRPQHALPPCEKACKSPQPHCILQVEVDHVKHAVRELMSRSKE